MLVKAEPAAQRLLLAWRRRPEPQVDRQTQQLDAFSGHPAPQCDPARALGRRDHQVGLAERPAPMEVDEVRDHSHQGPRASALPDRLVGDVVQQRMHRQHDVRVVLLQELAQHFAHGRSEYSADRGERWLRVARVIDRPPRGTRAANDR